MFCFCCATYGYYYTTSLSILAYVNSRKLIMSIIHSKYEKNNFINEYSLGRFDSRNSYILQSYVKKDPSMDKKDNKDDNIHK